jgi:hypothetical protein
MTIPNLIPVESKNLQAVGYDLHSQTLFIQFRRKDGAGSIYRYIAVPPAVHEALMQAVSKGQFFQGQVKNKYSFEKLS